MDEAKVSHRIPTEQKNDKWILANLEKMHREYNMYDSNTIFRNQHTRFFLNRLYAEGSQPEDIYMERFPKATGAEGQSETFMNLDWTVMPIMPKFVDIIRNRMIEMIQPEVDKRVVSLVATAIDPTSQNAKRKIKMDIIARQDNQNWIKDVMLAMGIDQEVLPEDMPQTAEELEVWEAMGNLKQKIEVSIEELIDFIFYLNDWKVILDMLVQDMVCCGMASVRDWTDSEGRIRISRNAPENSFTSWSDRPDFKDIRHGGTFWYASLDEIRQMNTTGFDEETWEEIEKNYMGKPYGSATSNYGNEIGSGMNYAQPPEKDKVLLMYGCFRSENALTFKEGTNKYGKRMFKKADFYYKPSKKNRKVQKWVQTWYEGVMIAGSKFLVSGGMMTDIQRDKNRLELAPPPFHVQAPNLNEMNVRSYVERMKPAADLFQKTWLDLQNTLNTARPDGVAIDINWLLGVDNGKGGTYDPAELLIAFGQSGLLLYNGMPDADGKIINQMPVKDLPSNTHNKIQELVNLMNFILDMFRHSVGLNEYTDASQPDPKSLVGIARIAAVSAAKTMSHNVEGMRTLIENLGKSVGSRLQTQYKHGKRWKGYIEGLGMKTKAIESIEDISLATFGIKLELRMTEEERQRINLMIDQQLQMNAQGQGGIELEDAIAIMDCPNFKVAQAMLVVRKKRRDKERMQQAQQAMQMQEQQAQMQHQRELEKISASEMAQAEGKRMTVDQKAGIKAIEDERKHQQAKEQKIMDIEGQEVLKMMDKLNRQQEMILQAMLDKEKVRGEKNDNLSGYQQ